MILTITMHANKIVSSERATVFLVDEPNQQLWSVSTDTGQEIRIPKTAGIAGHCCTAGKVINIRDAYADSRFSQEVDKMTGFRTQSILAIPMMEDDAARAAIREASHRRRSLSAGDLKEDMNAPGDENESDKVIGVIQMINKVSFDGQLEIFSEEDVEVMELFAKTVGPKLALSSMLARRHSENPEKKEADMALGKSDMGSGSAHKRNSNGATAAMVTMTEEEEEEEDS